jgi:hypothetical protein
MQRIQQIRRIAPGATIPLLQEQKELRFWVARGELSAPKPIRQIRRIRGIRVPI